MQRRSAIAVAGAVTGILIAGSVASVAVINAASSSTTTDEVPIVAASVIQPESVQIIEPAPSIDQTPLPAIVVPEPIEVTTSAVAEDGPTSRSDQPEPERSAAATTQPSAQESVEATPQVISAAQAGQAATAATPGTVLATTRVERGGYDAFAVQIERTDGSVVTGYVEATSGVVFDWVVDKAAPAPAATYYDDDYDDDDYDDDHDDDHDDDDDDDDDDERDGDDD